MGDPARHLSGREPGQVVEMRSIADVAVCSRFVPDADQPAAHLVRGQRRAELRAEEWREPAEREERCRFQVTVG